MSIQEENIGGAANIRDAISKKHAQGSDTSLGSQTENLDMNTHKIEGLVDPTTDQEAATKKYVDDNAGGIAGDGTVNPTNLLTNGNFELWSAGTTSAPDGWTLGGVGASIARESTIKKIGTYSAKLTRSGVDCYIYNNTLHIEKGIAYWTGKTVTVGCWVYATVAGRTKIQLRSTGGSNHDSSIHTGNSTWQWLTATGVIDGSNIGLFLYCFGGNTSVYFDGITLVEGSSIFAFSPKPLPEVNPTVQGLLTLDEGQIKFPTTQNASADANTLDDYEEGTYTGTLTCGTSGTITIHASYNTLAYTKIGRVVHVQGYLFTSAINAPVGSLRLNLPMASSTVSQRAGSFSGSININSGTGNSGVPKLYNSSWVSTIYVTIVDFLGIGTTNADDMANHIDASTEIIVDFSYIAA